jgi:hypothetical protein
MKYIIKLPLVLLIFLSLFALVPTNGTSNSLYLFEYSSMISIGRLHFAETVIMIMLLISHLFIFLLPFLTNNKSFYAILTLAPIIFVLLYFMADIFMAFDLIPFIILWIICLFIRKEFRSFKVTENTN